MNKYKTYISIDDTDEIGYPKSTGQISGEIRDFVEQNFSKCEVITRHQLFIHEDIPYTSHNSSMCFISYLDEKEKLKVLEFMKKHIEQNCAPSSQAGICIAFEKDFTSKDELINFGLDAKKKVLTKAEAYDMAKKQNIHLSEHKNAGAGVIGALAGVALRLYGFDGRVKGVIKTKAKILSLKEVLNLKNVEIIKDIDSKKELDLDLAFRVNPNIKLHIQDKLKAVYLNHKSTILVRKISEDKYQNLSIDELRSY